MSSATFPPFIFFKMEVVFGKYFKTVLYPQPMANVKNVTTSITEIPVESAKRFLHTTLIRIASPT